MAHHGVTLSVLCCGYSAYAIAICCLCQLWDMTADPTGLIERPHLYHRSYFDSVQQQTVSDSVRQGCKHLAVSTEQRCKQCATVLTVQSLRSVNAATYGSS